ncbi:MAG: hypothetical protein PHQ44_06425 [Anaerovibrio sp.]|nr:hypothetical protein [Anaerovibrio sp.]
MANISKGYTADMGAKMRSMPEINARYQQCCEKYKQFRNCSAEFREQKVMIYSELKAMGWVLGKSDQQINKEANF